MEMEAHTLTNVLITWFSPVQGVVCEAEWPCISTVAILSVLGVSITPSSKVKTLGKGHFPTIKSHWALLVWLDTLSPSPYAQLSELL